MTRISFLLVVLIQMIAVGHAQSEPMWGYRSPTNTSVLTPGEAAGITFPNTSWIDATAGGHITVTPVQSWSVATLANPDRIDGEFYRFGLEIKDYSSGLSETLDFTGLLGGSLWKSGTKLTNVFTGIAEQMVDLGDNRYTVALDAFEAPTGFGDAGAGKITADVTIVSLRDPVPANPPSESPSIDTAQTPEPSALLLGSIAIGAAGLSRLRRRKDYQ